MNGSHLLMRRWWKKNYMPHSLIINFCLCIVFLILSINVLSLNLQFKRSQLFVWVDFWVSVPTCPHLTATPKHQFLMSWENQSMDILSDSGSGIEPVSCYLKVACSIPLVCMLKDPWARYWPPNSWCAGWHLALQPPVTVYELLQVALYNNNSTFLKNVQTI